jgi:hypothetical protein
LGGGYAITHHPQRHRSAGTILVRSQRSRALDEASGPATGVRTTLSIVSNAATSRSKILASFTDGSLAAINTPLDSGGVTRIAFSPGLAYLENATNWMRLPRRSEFTVALRELLLDAIDSSNVKSLECHIYLFVCMPAIHSRAWTDRHARDQILATC